jgi:ABC-type dipeptide/oligopeptide/nickel transport system permease subunit
MPELNAGHASVVVPAAAIFITVLAANLFGNAFRDAFDPRLR